MTVTSETSAPYATSSSLLDILSRYRHRGMQTPINADVLGRSGISDSLISRTLQALTVLDLIDDEGMPTDTLEGIRLSPESEYKQRLQEWLRGAYADIFSYVDPMQDDDTKIRDAFRTYKPMGQQSRMVSLFTGLCDAADLRPEASAERPRPKTSSKNSSPPKGQRKMPGSTRKSTKSPSLDELPAPLEGLLSSLPAQGSSWTQANRDKFIETFGVVLDFCYSIAEDEATTTTDVQDED